jgi:hypothetical protein
MPFDFRGQIRPIYPDWPVRVEALEKARDRLLRAMAADEPGQVLGDDGRTQELADALGAAHGALERLDGLRSVWRWRGDPDLLEAWNPADARAADLLGSPRLHQPAELRRCFGDTNQAANEHAWLWTRHRIREFLDAVLVATRPPEPAKAPDPPPAGDPALDEEDVSVLRYLVERAPTLCVLCEIEAGAGVSAKTAGQRLNRLISLGLAIRSRGRRSGATVTDAGSDLLKRYLAG